MEGAMTEPVTRLKVEGQDREEIRKGASCLAGATTLAHAGLFFFKSNGQKVTAELPASVLRLLQHVMNTVAESGEAFLLPLNEEVSPEKAAELLGISRPIVYQRMDSGKLPFRQVGTHRRIRTADIAKLKEFEDNRRAFAAAISADTEMLETNYGQPTKSGS
jgi:excisionase family DNA binding protein